MKKSNNEMCEEGYPSIPVVDKSLLTKLTKNELVQRYLHDQESSTLEWRAVLDEQKTALDQQVKNSMYYSALYIEEKNKVAKIIAIISELNIPDRVSIWWVLMNLSKIIMSLKEIISILKEKK